ncbi:hypothetical protein ACFYPZ_24665 [Streptomyces sp. NPDC005506]|uniref:hypothetical protein n=1 Tax=Streptomyces sp. NPDC005506 TaxID=3364718 RepID=UPI0036A0DEB0
MHAIAPPPPISNELVLTESRTMRAQTIGRTDALDKVKALAMLPDSLHVTTEMAAAYYEVDTEAIHSLVRRNRDELEQNGMHTLQGAELRAFKVETGGQGDHLFNGVRTLRLFTRRALLNVGQLLTESQVARRVREHLLNVEQGVRPQAEPRQLPQAKRLPPKTFRQQYFSDVPEGRFFQHLYTHDYLLDQRNQRRDEFGNLTKDGFRHGHPKAGKGDRFFMLPEVMHVDANGRLRGRAVVRPDRIQDLVEQLISEGLRHNPSITRGPSRLALTASESTEVVDGYRITMRRGA